MGYNTTEKLIYGFKLPKYWTWDQTEALEPKPVGDKTGNICIGYWGDFRTETYAAVLGILLGRTDPWGDTQEVNIPAEEELEDLNTTLREYCTKNDIEYSRPRFYITANYG